MFNYRLLLKFITLFFITNNFFFSAIALGFDQDKNKLYWLEEKKLLIGPGEVGFISDFNPAPEQMIENIIEDSTVIIKDQKLYWAHNQEIVNTSSYQKRTAKNYHYFAGNAEEHYAYLFDGETLKIATRYVSLEKGGWDFIIYHSHLVNEIYKLGNKEKKFAASAGEISLNSEGKIRFLSNRSGHFKNSGKQFALFVNFLNEKGVFADTVTFEYWDIETRDRILDIRTQARGLVDTTVNYKNKTLKDILDQAQQFLKGQEVSLYPSRESLKESLIKKNDNWKITDNITFEMLMEKSKPLDLLKHMIKNNRNLDLNLTKMLEYLGAQKIIKNNILSTLGYSHRIEALNFLEKNLSSDDFYNLISNNKFLIKEYEFLIKKLIPKIYNDGDLLFLICNYSGCSDYFLSIIDAETNYENMILVLDKIWYYIDSSKRDHYLKKLISLLKENNNYEKAVHYASRLSHAPEAFYKSIEILTANFDEFYSYREFALESELKQGLIINKSSDKFKKILFDTYLNILSAKEQNTLITYELRDKSFFPSFYQKTAPVNEMVIYHMLNTLIFCGGNFSQYNLRNQSDDKLVDEYLDLLSKQARDYLIRIQNMLKDNKINQDFVLHIPVNQIWAFKTHYSTSIIGGNHINIYEVPEFASGANFRVLVNQTTVNNAILALDTSENHPLLLALGALPKRTPVYKYRY